MRLTFVYTATFASDWRRLRLGDEEARALEQLILENPESGAVIRESGGARKLRFASRGRGKSGAVRVVYALFSKAAHVYMLIAYAKNEQSTMTHAELADTRRLMAEIDHYLEKLSTPRRTS